MFFDSLMWIFIDFFQCLSIFFFVKILQFLVAWKQILSPDKLLKKMLLRQQNIILEYCDDVIFILDYIVILFSGFWIFEIWESCSTWVFNSLLMNVRLNILHFICLSINFSQDWSVRSIALITFFNKPVLNQPNNNLYNH